MRRWWQPARAALGALLASALVVSPLSAQPPETEWTEIVRGDPSTGVVALTLDAGGVAGDAQRILDTLRERNIRVTFFLAGLWVDTYPDLAQQVVADGHEVANHSYNHPDFASLSESRMVWELDYADHVIRTVAGAETSRPFWRPPFGSRNRSVLDVAAATGFRSVYWTLDSGDWRERVTAGQVVDRVLGSVQPGDIVIHHLAAEATASGLNTILDGIEAQGWRVGTVSEALGRPWPPTPAATAE